MTAVLTVTDSDNVHVLGTRYTAVAVRREVEGALLRGQHVQLDFKQLLVTQSFADELLGPLVLRRGPGLLNNLSFAGCTEDTKAIVRLVLASRLGDYAARDMAGMRACSRAPSA